ncbi:MAG: hypothetical protein ACJAQT_001852 [Akkermansiaceae bacterium]|jgi:uncharacterized protein YegP (UPF0339 family)
MPSQGYKDKKGAENGIASAGKNSGGDPKEISAQRGVTVPVT